MSETIPLDDVEARVREDAPGRGAALGRGLLMGVDHLVTSGTFSLDGGTWDVDNNVWIVGDDRRGDRRRRRARRRRDRRGRRRPARRRDRVHPRARRPRQRRARPRRPLRRADPAQPGRAAAVGHDVARPCAGRRAADGRAHRGRGRRSARCRRPGHSPGSTCLYAPDLGTVFTGDTLFAGGPGRHRPVVLVASTRSSTRSARPCSRCRRRRRSAPATATARASAPRPRTWRSGSRAATECVHARRGTLLIDLDTSAVPKTVLAEAESAALRPTSIEHRTASWCQARCRRWRRVEV